jgi:hypothetical protein
MYGGPRDVHPELIKHAIGDARSSPAVPADLIEPEFEKDKAEWATFARAMEMCSPMLSSRRLPKIFPVASRRQNPAIEQRAISRRVLPGQERRGAAKPATAIAPSVHPPPAQLSLWKMPTDASGVNAQCNARSGVIAPRVA